MRIGDTGAQTCRRAVLYVAYHSVFNTRVRQDMEGYQTLPHCSRLVGITRKQLKRGTKDRINNPPPRKSTSNQKQPGFQRAIQLRAPASLACSTETSSLSKTPKGTIYVGYSSTYSDGLPSSHGWKTRNDKVLARKEASALNERTERANERDKKRDETLVSSMDFPVAPSILPGPPGIHHWPLSPCP